MESGIELISKERKRQIEELGFDYSNDSLYTNNELADAAACYAILPNLKLRGIAKKLREVLWPWNKTSYKPTPDDRVRELVKAGALIAAQIDWIQNQNKKP